MKRNMGTLDRRLRLFLAAPALILAGIALGPGGAVPVVLYTLAGLMVATSLTASCPLYTLLGVRTCPVSPTRSTRAGTEVSH